MIFYNLCHYFWGQHCWLTETNIQVSIALNCVTAPLPYRCSGVPKYACCVNKLSQNIGCKSEYDVIMVTSHFTNSVYPVTMTTICHCSILEFGRGHPIKQSPRAPPELCTPLNRLAQPFGLNCQFLIKLRR